MQYLQNSLVLCRSVQVSVPSLSRLELPEGPLPFTLTCPALTILVLLLEVVFAVEDGELLPGLDVPDGLEEDHIALLLDELGIGRTVMVDKANGATTTILESDLDEGVNQVCVCEVYCQLRVVSGM